MFCENVVTCVRWMCKNYCTFGLFKWHCSYSSYRVFFLFFLQSFVCTFFKKIFIKTNMWGPVISGVLLRLYGMGLRPNDPIRGHWQVWGWSAKVITGVALKEELKVFMVIPNLSEVKSYLGTFVRGSLKHSYSSRYSFKGTLWREVEYWILDERGG